MTDMHKEILSEDQIQLLPLVKEFRSDFFLVGGTAVALHLGHRRSFDFDLFSNKAFVNKNIRTKINQYAKINKTLIESQGEMTLLVGQTRMTFFEYRHKIAREVAFDEVITMPDLLTLGAMKAEALGGRAKWKDYLDLYFIFKHHSLAEVVELAEQLFGGEFNHKLFREQLAYHQDISYQDEAIMMPGFEVEREMVLKTLIDVSLS